MDLPDYEKVMKLYDVVYSLIQDKKLVSVYALDSKGLVAAVSKMAFGNKLGVSIRGCLKAEDAFAPGFGNLVAEVAPEDTDAVKAAMEEAGLRPNVSIVGSVLEEAAFRYGDVEISMDEAISAWTGTLEKVFPTRAGEDTAELPLNLYDTKNIYICKNKVAKPTVFIPVFPGTNCDPALLDGLCHSSLAPNTVIVVAFDIVELLAMFSHIHITYPPGQYRCSWRGNQAVPVPAF